MPPDYNSKGSFKLLGQRLPRRFAPRNDSSGVCAGMIRLKPDFALLNLVFVEIVGSEIATSPTAPHNDNIGGNSLAATTVKQSLAVPPDAHRNGQSHHRLSQLFDMTKDHYSLRILGGLYHPRRCLKLP